MNTDQRLTQYMERYRPVLVTLAEAMIAPGLRGALDASDLVQNTLMEAHRDAGDIAASGEGPFFAWLRAALRNNVLDAAKHLTAQKNDYRRNVRISDLEASFSRLDLALVDDETSPSQKVEKNEQVVIMLAELQKLAVDQRTAIILKHLRGLSLNEVADSMRLSESSTAGLLHRGRQQLVRLLGDRNRD